MLLTSLSQRLCSRAAAYSSGVSPHGIGLSSSRWVPGAQSCDPWYTGRSRRSVRASPNGAWGFPVGEWEFGRWDKSPDNGHALFRA